MFTRKFKLICLLAVIGILLYPVQTFARIVRSTNLGIVRGVLFKPTFSLKPTAEITNLNELEEDLNIRARTSRDSAEVGKILNNGDLEITAHLRGLDGPGSSLDLPNFQEKLTLPDKPLPSTATLTSDYKVNIVFKKASFKDIKDLPDELKNENPQNFIIYSAPDYNIPKEHPYIARPIKENNKVVGFDVWKWNTKEKVYENFPIPINENLPNLADKLGLPQAPAYIFGRLFGITGVKIDLQEISPMALAGGMESSNAFMVSLLSAASVLSGANLSWADIVVTAVLLENKVLGGENSTGGQGHLASILGGAYHHIWLSGKEDYYGARSVPLVSPNEFNDFKKFIEDHMLLVQYGKEYKDGNPVGTRAADLTNTMWTDLLVEEDEVGFPLHQEKLDLTEEYVNALKNRDIKTIIETIQRYVEIRNELTLRWAEAVVKEGKEEWLTRLKDEYKEALALYGLENSDYARVKEEIEKNPELLTQKAIENLKRILREGISLYTADAQEFVENAKDKGFAFMPLGAGGPGAVMIAVAENLGDLKNFLEENGINEITNEQEIRDIIRGDGKIRGYVPFKISNQGIQFGGIMDDEELRRKYNLNEPQ